MTTTFSSPQEALSAAVRGMFLRWTALNLSIENHYDRDRVTAAAESMYSQAVQLAAQGRDEDDITEMLYTAFDNIETDVEDGSPELVAASIIRVRDAAARGDFAPAAALAAPSAANNAVRARSVVQHEKNVDDADADTSISAPVPQPPVAQPRQPPQVDDDGFTTVVRRGH